jgi:hypothetical protein
MSYLYALAEKAGGSAASRTETLTPFKNATALKESQ